MLGNCIRDGESRRGGLRDGFMLVEVLATMTISALLLAALFSIASLTFHTSARIERLSDRIEVRTRILAALTRETEQAIPMRWAGRKGTFIFSGSDQILAFAAERRRPDGTIGVNAVVVESGKAITRRLASVPPSAASFDDIEFGPSDAISHDGYEVAFAYYARLPDGREALLDTWQDASQFPIAIRLGLSGPDGATSVVRIKIAADTEPGCAFPEKGRCNLRPPSKRDGATTAETTSGDGG